MDLNELKNHLRRFASERDWEKFHSPKNLTMALSVEVAELVEHFQWLSEAESGNLTETARNEVAHEIADVQIYLALLADKLGVDILEAVDAKLQDNEHRYPASRVRGSSRKACRHDETKSVE